MVLLGVQDMGQQVPAEEVAHAFAIWIASRRSAVALCSIDRSHFSASCGVWPIITELSRCTFGKPSRNNIRLLKDTLPLVRHASQSVGNALRLRATLL
jgi:hypothetical protein